MASAGVIFMETIIALDCEWHFVSVAAYLFVNSNALFVTNRVRIIKIKYNKVLFLNTSYMKCRSIIYNAYFLLVEHANLISKPWCIYVIISSPFSTIYAVFVCISALSMKKGRAIYKNKYHAFNEKNRTISLLRNAMRSPLFFTKIQLKSKQCASLFLNDQGNLNLNKLL